MGNSALDGLTSAFVDPAVQRLAKAAANSYKGFFGFNARLAKGVVVGNNLLPIKIFAEPTGHYIYLNSTNDEAVMIQLLRSRNMKAIRIFVDYKDESLSFVTQMMQLSEAKIPFSVSIAVGRYSYGKRTALYVLRDRSASLSTKRPPYPMTDRKVVTIDLQLPSAQLEEGLGGGSQKKLIK